MEGCGYNWEFLFSNHVNGRWMFMEGCGYDWGFHFSNCVKSKWLWKHVAMIEDSLFLEYAVSVGIWFATFWRNVVLLQCQELTAQWHSNISQKNRNISHTNVTSKCVWLLSFPNCFLTPVTSLVHQRPSMQMCNSKDGTYQKSTWNITWTALCTSEEGNGKTDFSHASMAFWKNAVSFEVYHTSWNMSPNTCTLNFLHKGYLFSATNAMDFMEQMVKHSSHAN